MKSKNKSKGHKQQIKLFKIITRNIKKNNKIKHKLNLKEKQSKFKKVL